MRSEGKDNNGMIKKESDYKSLDEDGVNGVSAGLIQAMRRKRRVTLLIPTSESKEPLLAGVVLFSVWRKMR
jgi:hypothetical protein